MSEPELNLPTSEQVTSEQAALEPIASEPAGPRKPNRLRRFFLRHVPFSLAGTAVFAVLAMTGLYFWMSSAQFEGIIRKRLIATLEQSTGGKVEIATFHWHLLGLEAEADGLVIHGTEAQGEAPYGRVDRLSARVSILGLWSPSVRLRDLEIIHPVLHLIVYPDGSTNQPQPRQPRPQPTHDLDTFFNLQAGHVALEQGMIDYDNRAASFDFQNRWAPVDFQANEVSVVLSYVPASAQLPESYRIEAGATDLMLARSSSHHVAKASSKSDSSKSGIKPVHGFFQATLDFTRSAAYLRSFRVAARAADGVSHSLDLTGSLQDFTHPRWQAKTVGDLDMKLLDPVFGYPSAPEGIAHLNLDAAGEAGEFRTDGTVHIEDGSYIGPGAYVTGLRVDTHVHADQAHLLITNIVAVLRQGGQLEGSIDLGPWLPSVAGGAVMQATETHPSADRNAALIHPPPPDVRVNGKVIADMKDVSLDALLDMVSLPPFQRVGIASILNGPATANWSNGDTRTVTVTASVNLSAAAHPPDGEVPAYGAVDATYTQRNGAVDLRKLELHLPASEFTAHGNMGAYPVSSPSAMTVDFHSRNLGEFDTVLRSLGLKRNGKSGADALPVALGGQADFHGTWTGSLASPHFAGEAKATQLAIEMPTAHATPNAQPQLVHFDSVEAAGSYSAVRVAIDHAVLQRGNSKINLSGSLVASAADESTLAVPQFDTNSALHLHLDASKVNVYDIQPLLDKQLPFNGTLEAQIQADGPVHALGGSGWVQLDNGTVYGEPVTRIRAEGSMANDVFTFSSINVAEPAGSASATGSYDLNSRRFQLAARGNDLDVSKIDWLRRQQESASGKLAFTVRGSGTFDDPQLEGNATLTSLMLGGEPIGGLQLVAHSAGHSLFYDMTTHLDATELTLHGQTALDGDHATQARIDFSRFNIDSLLKLAHVSALSGQSALAGTVTVQGPLAHPDQLRGEARLLQMEATVAGVHLKSEGGVHATLANDKVSLDPLHITGEGTDMRVQGNLALNGKQQLDLAANGSINLKLAETIDPDLTADGVSTFTVEAHGPLKAPNLQGRVNFQNGALSFGDLPNGLSQLHGTLEFNQDRLEVKSLTAMSGGGPLTVNGYLAYQHGIYADLSVTGKGVRIRYPQGVSSLADSSLRLQGTQNNLQLSGDVMITRFSVSPDLDFAALAAQANSVQTVTPQDAATNHIRLDVHILSSPQLNFQNAFAKLAGDVDLRLRGTVANPALQGRVSITDGSAMIAGTRYDLQRGDITFSNPVRIEPLIDLSATARVEDYDITLNLNGTPGKLSVSYRSDPPLPESDVVALLALGRTENQQRIYTQQQEQALSNPTTNALLGGALNATVSSRVQKLFGAGSVKVDPNYLGPFGNSTSRIIVEEQLGRNLTLTYATDVNTTGQQLLQAEIAINRHVSLLVARDESGVFSMVVKATRRFR